MKIKDGYTLKKVAGTDVVLPVGNSDFSSVITLNPTGAFLCAILKDESDEKTLIDAFLSEYNVDAETASRDVNAFVDKMRTAGLLDE